MIEGKWGDSRVIGATKADVLEHLAEEIELTLDPELEVRGLDTAKIGGRIYYVKVTVSFIPG